MFKLLGYKVLTPDTFILKLLLFWASQRVKFTSVRLTTGDRLSRWRVLHLHLKYSCPADWCNIFQEFFFSCAESKHTEYFFCMSAFELLLPAVKLLINAIRPVPLKLSNRTSTMLDRRVFMQLIFSRQNCFLTPLISSLSLFLFYLKADILAI